MDAWIGRSVSPSFAHHCPTRASVEVNDFFVASDQQLLELLRHSRLLVVPFETSKRQFSGSVLDSDLHPAFKPSCSKVELHIANQRNGSYRIFPRYGFSNLRLGLRSHGGSLQDLRYGVFTTQISNP